MGTYQGAQWRVFDMSLRKSIQQSTISTTEAEELRSMVCELNESIAYLSKMVVQLQQSLRAGKSNRAKENADDNEKPKTIH